MTIYLISPWLLFLYSPVLHCRRVEACSEVLPDCCKYDHHEDVAKGSNNRHADEEPGNVSGFHGCKVQKGAVQIFPLQRALGHA